MTTIQITTNQKATSMNFFVDYKKTETVKQFLFIIFFPFKLCRAFPKN